MMFDLEPQRIRGLAAAAWFGLAPQRGNKTTAQGKVAWRPPPWVTRPQNLFNSNEVAHAAFPPAAGSPLPLRPDNPFSRAAI